MSVARDRDTDRPTLARTAARAGVLSAATAIAAVVASFGGASDLWIDVIVFAGAIAVGELFVLGLDGEAELPLAYAVVLVVASGLPVDAALVAVAAGHLVAALSRLRPASASGRTNVLVRRLAVSGASVLAVDTAERLIDDVGGARSVAMGGLLVGMIVMVIADQLARAAFRRAGSLSRRGITAWAALLSSGALMALGFRPDPGGAGVGLWGPLLFSVPLWFAWYSFVRLDAIQRTYEQTIDALSCAPELGGLVVPGHATRVAALADAVAVELGLGDTARRDLDAAARLHHVGQVTLDDPQVLGRPNSPAEVAAMSAAMLRGLGPLSAAAAIVAGEPLSARDDARWHGAHVRVLSQVLKATSAFDDLTAIEQRDVQDALSVLAAADGVYDSEVLDALRRVTARLAPASV